VSAGHLFECARVLAAADSYESAIDAFLMALTVEPDNVEGHQALREVALERKAAGGKRLGFDRVKLTAWRARANDRELMFAEEKLLAYDPANVAHMIELARHARSAGFTATAEWIEVIARRARGA
jgi:hypothetical protein